MSTRSTSRRKSAIYAAEKNQPTTTRLLLAGAATTALFLLSEYVPSLRLWGVDSWSYLPVVVPPFLAGLAILTAAAAIIALRRFDPVAGPAKFRYPVVAVVVGALAAAALILFRTEAHFFGDGYTVLSLLSSADPLLKSRELGESLLHIWVKDLTGQSGEPAALLSFRLLSIAAGALLIAAVLLSASRLFERTAPRLLFSLGVLTCGYMLLFFGYVEYYSLFGLAVAAFALTGLLSARRVIPRWIPLVPFAFAVFFHVLGVTLLPALVYIVTSGTRFSRLSRKTIWLLFFLGIIAAVGALTWLIREHMFVRLALLSPIDGRFTVDGYTLFSPTHLLDYANLLLLLIPSVLILFAALTKTAPRTAFRNRDTRFLLVTAASALLAAFIFDPKLGMARDWDLFAFAGIPTAILLFWLLFQSGPSRFTILAATLAITLNLLSLGPRVAIVNDPPVALEQFTDYLRLDHGRARTGWLLVKNYYEDRGDSLAAAAVQEQWNEAHPERVAFKEFEKLRDTGRDREAVAQLHRIMAMDPTYPGVWSNLGFYFIRSGQYDSAVVYLKTALGLNPHDASALSNLGLAYLEQGRLDAAEETVKSALDIVSEPASWFVLARIYRQQGKRAKFEEALRNTAALPNAPAPVLVNIADYYAASNRLSEALTLYRRALENGLDTAAIESRLERVPALESLLTP